MHVPTESNGNVTVSKPPRKQREATHIIKLTLQYQDHNVNNVQTTEQIVFVRFKCVIVCISVIMEEATL